MSSNLKSHGSRIIENKPKSTIEAPSDRPPNPYNNNNNNASLTIMRRVKRKGDGPLTYLTHWLLDNQAGLSFNLLALLLLSHVCLPKARPYTSKFFTFSYHNRDTGKYGIGYDDFYFMTFCVVLLTGLRAGCMDHVLSPLARYLGLSKRKQATRFAEQAWMLIYYNIFWPMGMYIYYNSPYFLNMEELWTDWPTRELGGLVKAYVLIQWSFWLQQVVVLHIEERRKDHWQMLAHHLVTIVLISASYAYHYTRVANLIMVLIDVVDLVFPLAKCLKYLGYTTICDVLFGIFVALWLASRHIIYVMVCWSVYFDAPRIMTHACFTGPADKLQGPLPTPEGWSYLLEPFRNPNGLICFNNNIMYGFIAYLLTLQVMMIMWSFFIVKVAARVLSGKNAEDIRSDGEDDNEEENDPQEEQSEYEEVQPLEQEVGVEDIDLKAWERRTGVKRERAVMSSGVTLPGHSDRKELLNRIGCEKQIE